MTTEQRWTWHMSQMVMTDPFSYKILLMMNKVPSMNLPTMGVKIEKGKLHLYYNPKFLGELTDPELRFVITHEVFHVCLHHCSSRGPSDKKEHDLYNYGADLAANSLISENERRKMPRGAHKGMLPSDFEIPSKLSMEQYVALLREVQDQLPKYGRFDDHDGWSEEHAESIDEQIRSTIEGMSKSDKYWGNMSADCKDIIIAAQRPKVDWTQHLHSFMGGLLSHDKRYTKRFPNRRYGWPFVGQIHEYTGKVLVGLDVSGSMSKKQLSQLLCEINFLREYMQVDLVLFDAEITIGPDPFDEEKIEFGIIGGGGTSFQPVMDLAEKEGYQALIMATDGYAGACTKPQGVDQILWCLIDSESCPVDWGEKLYITSDEGYGV